ncbi:MAG TPA: ATP-binding protein [Chlorobaculum sp.]|nr:ATP-binding protein [Chlorobaculum sp.]
MPKNKKQLSSDASPLNKPLVDYINVAVDPICIIDPSGKILDVNSSFAETYGKKGFGCQGANIYELLESMELHELAVNLGSMAEEVVRTGKGLSFEDVRDTKHMMHSVSLVDSCNTDVIKLVVHIQDITHIRATEKDNRNTRLLWELAFDKCNIGGWIVNLQNYSVFHTLEYDHLFGYEEPVADWGLKFLMDHIVLEDRAIIEKVLRETKMGLNEWNIEYRIRRKDGEIRWLWDLGEVKRDDNGTAVRLLIVTSDITARKLAEIEREQLQSQLQHAQKMELLGQLAGGIAHDFNNVLASIIGQAELLLRQSDENHSSFERIESIIKSAEHSAGIVRQLLGFSRKQMVQSKIIQLDDALDDFRPMFMTVISENVQLQWNLDAKGAFVKIDPSQLVQIITNLCINSRDAIIGTGTITISTDGIHIIKSDCDTGHPCRTAGDYVRISVSDTGCGMEKHLLPHIFEPFFTTKGVGKGSGLGLSMVYGIVKQNNGYIDCQTEQGKGTVFYVFLPRHDAAEDEKESSNVVQTDHLNKKTILVVEDESCILEIISTILEEEGYTVLTANNAENAISIANKLKSQIDLLISDILLPNMNGIQLSHFLMSSNPNLKVLFMSGYSSEVIGKNGVNGEEIGFISKPFTINEFLKVFDATLYPAQLPQCNRFTNA